MKKSLSITFLIIFSFNFIYSQNDELFIYTTLEPILVFGYDFETGVIKKDDRKVLKEGLDFRKIGDPIESNDSDLKTVIVISVIDVPIEAGEKGKLSKYVNTSDNLSFFCMPQSKFKEGSNVKRKFKTWFNNVQVTLGTLLVPAKIRFGTGDEPVNFSASYTLGTNIGVKFRMTPYRPYFLSFVAFFGLTSVSVDSVSTKGFKTQSENSAALTPAIGIVFEFSDTQIGALIGWDFVSGDLSKHWLYNGKSWFSLGLGYQFLKSN